MSLQHEEMSVVKQYIPRQSLAQFAIETSLSLCLSWMADSKQSSPNTDFRFDARERGGQRDANDIDIHLGS